VQLSHTDRASDGAVDFGSKSLTVYEDLKCVSCFVAKMCWMSSR